MNKYKILSEIIELCLSVDVNACVTYNKFALECKNPALVEQWKLRAEEERNHIRFWKQALILSKQKKLPLIFENPQEVKEKLIKIKKTIAWLFSKFNAFSVPSEELTLAFLLESYMLHPAFIIMFHEYKFINGNIEDDYGEHILSFIDMAKSYGDLDFLHIELFNEALYDLYVLSKELLKESLYDSLCGIYNRRGFFNGIKPTLSLAARTKSDIGIIMIDFDNFKKINDTSGHQAGDAALKGGAAIIKAQLRGSCISARYGGDEFIVLTDIENANSLPEICERIRKNIDIQSQKISGIHFTVSLGAASGKISDQQEKSVAEIIHNADKNLLKTKKTGKNNWLV